jgi:hypothetical protein
MIGIGPRGREPWFRRLPLLLPDHNPSSWFGFLFYSLKDALVASCLWGRLTTGAGPTLLATVTLAKERAILRFFGEAYQHGSPADRQKARATLQDMCSDTANSHAAANATALLGSLP